MPATKEYCTGCKQRKYDTRLYLPISVERTRTAHNNRARFSTANTVRLCRECASRRAAEIKPAVQQKVQQCVIYRG